ncbi:MAG: 5'-deoxynucleotidase [Planctomycetota bacterium]|jgi:5'-deoxynucleotidase|nr:5'-deoxynucleotidase [Planctomycetota bacterium]
MPSHFFAYLARLRLIRRWSLMQNTWPENVQEHSFQVAILAHALAVIRQNICGKEAQPERAAWLALFHDASEVITGDLPTPVKYHDSQMRQAYHDLESTANQHLLDFLPASFQTAYQDAFVPKNADLDSWELVKAADKLAAWLKCREELKSGNPEFALAEATLAKRLRELSLPEVDYFIDNFAPAFSLTLDELTLPDSEGSG